MKIAQLSIAILVVSLVSFDNLHAGIIEKVIYGDDNRVDIYQSSNSLYKNLARSTAAMIASSHLRDQGDSFLIESPTMEEAGICSDARFAKQIEAANCSGFLIGEQYLVTAGHCIEKLEDCDSYRWVFDYANTTEEKDTFLISKTEVYKCTEIIERELDYQTDNDFSLVKLDRPVTNRVALKFRKKGKISKDASLVVIGHPTGLPTKIADDATVRTNSNKYFFVANLDTFGGNSGSAVFDAKTGVVEGILVRGEQDYVEDTEKLCLRPKVCSMEGCRGEDVTRITNIKSLRKL